MAQFMDAPSPRKLLKIFNLRTTKAIEIKLGRIVYLYEALHLTKDLGVVLGGSGGVAGKPSKKPPKMGFLPPLFEFSKLYHKL